MCIRIDRRIFTSQRADQKVVGYVLDNKQHPILQSPEDPFPGY